MVVVAGRIGKAVVEIELDDKDFKRQTGNATAGLDSQMKSLQTSVMGVVGALGLVAAAKGAVNLLTDLTKKAIEVADSFEVMEKQLITLTKSEDKARGFFEAIKNFAKETPYQVRDLAQSFNMLYPVFKDQTIPMMKLIGDTAAGTGRTFEDTASAMMRMATGDWGVEIMRQLFLVKADFGDMFGPNGELVASQEEAWGKLEEILGDRFGGMMVGMMDTVQGKVSNLKDVLDSLANSVGAELTPITKELLDLLIEVVKQAEESGELKDAAREFAKALAENKDELAAILGLLPSVIDLFTVMVESGATLLDAFAELNREWDDLFGPHGQGMISDTNEILKYTYQLMKYTLTTAQKLGYVIGLAAQGRISEAWDAAGKPMPGRPAEVGKMESGRGIEGRIAEYLEAGGTPEGAERYAREMGATEEQIRFGWEYYRRAKKIKPPPPGKGGKKVAKLPEIAQVETARAAQKHVEQLSESELSAARKQQEEELEYVRQLAETYAEYLDPTSYIINGLKSGEMKQAIQDFAVELGTRVSEELVRKLIVMGIMAILNAVTGGAGGGVQMALGRGGIIKAASGLLGTFPARPGGWHIPFGDAMVNFSEAGQAETLGVFPPGRRGQDLITGPLARMFNIPVMPPIMINPNAPAVTVNAETRPNINVTNTFAAIDRRGVTTATKAERGRVNKAVTIRQ